MQKKVLLKKLRLQYRMCENCIAANGVAGKTSIMKANDNTRQFLETGAVCKIDDLMEQIKI